MKITIEIPIKKYVFLFKKTITKIKLKIFILKNELKLDSQEIEGLASSLATFPDFSLEKVTRGYVLNNNLKNT